MICPHCVVAIRPEFEETYIDSNDETDWWTSASTCPNCTKVIVYLVSGSREGDGYHFKYLPENERLIWPKGTARKLLSSEVPGKYSEDYKEACLVLADSPKASAALSRRCLQNLLLDEEKVKKGELSRQIQEVLDKNKYPSDLAESVDAIRNIGNFAAHPLKDRATGEIIDVEPGEAEWNLDVVEMLFDYYFVQPAIRKARKDALNEKLARAGKPQMK